MADMSEQDRAVLLAMLDQALREGERTNPPPAGEEGDWLYGSFEIPEPDENGWIMRGPAATGWVPRALVFWRMVVSVGPPANEEYVCDPRHSLAQWPAIQAAINRLIRGQRVGDRAGDEAPAPPEAVVRVQRISDSKALKRHLLRMFDQGQPRYPDAYDADAEPRSLWPDMVRDFVEGWQLIDAGGNGHEQSVIALALTFSMPVGTDPAVNEAAVLAVAGRVFAGHDRVWVAGEHEGPFVKMLIEYRDEDDRALSSGPADLRRYREAYASELGARGVVAQTTTRGSRGLGFSEARNAYKAGQRLDNRNACGGESSEEESAGDE